MQIQAVAPTGQRPWPADTLQRSGTPGRRCPSATAHSLLPAFLTRLGGSDWYRQNAPVSPNTGGPRNTWLFLDGVGGQGPRKDRTAKGGQVFTLSL